MLGNCVYFGYNRIAKFEKQGKENMMKFNADKQDVKALKDMTKVLLLLWIVILLMDIGLLRNAFSDYIKYKLHTPDYTVQSVEIERVRSGKMSGKVYFEYEVDGEECEGEVNYAFFDSAGEEIDIAFDSDMHYVRPQIIVGPSLIMAGVITAMMIYMVIGTVRTLFRLKEITKI